MQREVLTIRTNIPRNSARNSLKMSRLRPNLSFIFLLLSFSIFPPSRLLLSSSEQNKQLPTRREPLSDCRCRLPPPTRCGRTEQAARRVKLSASVSLCNHKGSSLYWEYGLHIFPLTSGPNSCWDHLYGFLFSLYFFPSFNYTYC